MGHNINLLGWHTEYLLKTECKAAQLFLSAPSRGGMNARRTWPHGRDYSEPFYELRVLYTESGILGTTTRYQGLVSMAYDRNGRDQTATYRMGSRRDMDPFPCGCPLTQPMRRLILSQIQFPPQA